MRIPASFFRSRNRGQSWSDTPGRSCQSWLSLLALCCCAILPQGARQMRSKPRPEAVGWWVGDIDDDALVKLEQLDWGVYTIVRPQFGPTVANDGSCECNLTANQAKLVSIVHSKGLKVQASPALDVRTVLPTSVGGKGEMAYREQYIKTIGAAVAECRFDGLEFDYEPLNDCSATYPENCTITPEHAHEFTVLMADIKKAMGSDKLMSEDVGVWGLTQGSYPLKLTPWVNVTMLNRGDIDFINTMSYHHPREGGILPWQQDAMWFDAHGFDRSRVNLGIGYYSFNFTNNSHPFETGEVVVGEPSWETLSKLCPNVDYDQSICKDVTFVGKKQNYDIGRFIQEQGWRGVFPWAASYDDVGSTSNNTMATWLGKGLRG